MKIWRNSIFFGIPWIKNGNKKTKTGTEASKASRYADSFGSLVIMAYRRNRKTKGTFKIDTDSPVRRMMEGMSDEERALYRKPLGLSDYDLGETIDMLELKRRTSYLTEEERRILRNAQNTRRRRMNLPLRLGDSVRVREGAGLSSGIEGTLVSYERYLELGGDPKDFLLAVSPMNRLAFIEVSKSRYYPNQRVAVVHKSATMRAE